MTTPDGKVYKYNYINLLKPTDLPSSEHLLSQVVYPDNTPQSDADNPSVTYHYEDPLNPYALTGITDERGVRFATWTYDARGRVLTSKHASGVDSYSFA